MVAALFLLALFSFALMGLFLVSLTIYSGLKARGQRVDEAADDLERAFASRRDLLRDAERLVDGPAPPEGAGHLIGVAERAAATRDIVAWAAIDAGVRRSLADLLDGGARPDVPGGILAELRQRLEQTDAAVSSGRRSYNTAATEFNQARSLVPAALVARIARLADRPLLGGSDGLPDRPAADAAARRR